MPLIEELPINQPHRVTHGWAYVPDTGPALAISAIQPGNRKRNRDGTSAAKTATATAKQQKAIQARLDSLDRENYKDGVVVPVPPRASRSGAGDSGGTEKKRDKKTMPNVRRILTYQRAFAHYLADEEANMAAAGGGGGGAAAASGQQGTTGASTSGGAGGASSQTAAQQSQATTPGNARTDSRRRSSALANNANDNSSATMSTPTPTPSTPSTPAVPSSTPSRRGRPPNKDRLLSRRQAEKEGKQSTTTRMAPPPKPSSSTPSSSITSKLKNEHEDPDTIMVDATPPSKPNTSASLSTNTTTTTTTNNTTASASASNPSTTTTTTTSKPTKPQPETNSLLKVLNLPKMPSDRVMALLVSEPPLSYTAARATFPSVSDEDGAGSGGGGGGVTTKPARRFCGTCGYWGRVKCRKCGEWTCGLMECWRGHEGVCVAGGY